MVHFNEYVPAVVTAGVKIAAGLFTSLNCESNVLGPLFIDQVPRPLVGVLAPSVVLLVVEHNVCAEPALAVVGVADTVSVAEALFNAVQPVTVTTQR